MPTPRHRSPHTSFWRRLLRPGRTPQPPAATVLANAPHADEMALVDALGLHPGWIGQPNPPASIGDCTQAMPAPTRRPTPVPAVERSQILTAVPLILQLAPVVQAADRLLSTVDTQKMATVTPLRTKR